MFLFAETKGLTFFCSAHFLVISESAFLNVSILMSDRWAVSCLHCDCSTHFAITVILILPTSSIFSRVCIYELVPSPIVSIVVVVVIITQGLIDGESVKYQK